MHAVLIIKLLKRVVIETRSPFLLVNYSLGWWNWDFYFIWLTRLIVMLLVYGYIGALFRSSGLYCCWSKFFHRQQKDKRDFHSASLCIAFRSFSTVYHIISSKFNSFSSGFMRCTDTKKSIIVKKKLNIFENEGDLRKCWTFVFSSPGACTFCCSCKSFRLSQVSKLNLHPRRLGWGSQKA